jgi:hypothetical protein
VYGFTPASSGQLNLDFSLLKPGVTTYCYQTANNTQQGVAGPAILLQLASDTLLHLGATSTTQCGAGPWAIAKSIDYAR